MEFTPIAPLELDSSIKKELLIKAEQVILDSQDLLSGYDKVTISEFKEMLRIVNCYYSNKIESEGTHPINIEKAINGEYAIGSKEKNLQHLAIAYIDTQKYLEDLHHDYSGFGKDLIRETHKSIYSHEGMEDFLEIEYEDKTVTMVPGELRKDDVKIGSHIAPSPNKLDGLISSYQKLYTTATKFTTKAEKLIYILSSHHRFVWIHPFIDGNGRTSRLLLDSLLYNMDLKGYGLWNISRGLAIKNKIYKKVLREADELRLGDRDGRGPLSTKYLTQFVDFMLDVALDQISFMKEQLRLTSFKQRLGYFIEDVNKGRYINEKKFPNGSLALLKEVYERGEIPRGEVMSIVGLKQTNASLLIKELLKRGFLQSDSPRGPIRAKITASFAMRMFLELIPEH